MPKQFALFLLLIGGALLPRLADGQKTTPTRKAAEAQSTPYPITPADSAIHFADSIFRQPILLFQLAEPDIPADIQSILIRFNNAVAANRQWFQDYRIANAGKPLPYNQGFGISAEEYKRLQNLEQTPPQLVPTDTQKITVIREAGFIQFHTDGDIRLLDFLLIDPKNDILVFGGDTIPFMGRAATAASNPYGEWQGYTWRLEKADAASTIATSRLTARVVEINMGLAPATLQPTQPQPTQPTQTQPAPHSRIFLHLKYQDMQDGATRANLELVGYLL